MYAAEGSWVLNAKYLSEKNLRIQHWFNVYLRLIQDTQARLEGEIIFNKYLLVLIYSDSVIHTSNCLQT